MDLVAKSGGSSDTLKTIQQHASNMQTMAFLVGGLENMFTTEALTM